MGICGYLWVFVGICEYLWVFVGICGYLVFLSSLTNTKAQRRKALDRLQGDFHVGRSNSSKIHLVQMTGREKERTESQKKKKKKKK